MPKLWEETIESHRAAVVSAILDTTAALVARNGLLSVTMSQVAEEAGIGRATLYKYYPDVESILAAWHQRLIAGHMKQLAELASNPVKPSKRLETVLDAYARIQQALRPHGTELAAALHRSDHVAHTEDQLAKLIEGLLAEGVRAGEIRDDVPPHELARYCLHALNAASALRPGAAVSRLVSVTIDGLRRQG